MSLTTTLNGAFGNLTTTVINSGSYITQNGSWVAPATVDSDVKNLIERRLDAIEERLGILRPNNDLEGKWEKLKSLGDEYRALEKDILEKEKIWDLIKK